MNMNMKRRWSLESATETANSLVEIFTTFCERLIIAGSIRRREPEVGDIELLYIPRITIEPNPGDMFATMDVNLMDQAIGRLEKEGTLSRRLSSVGSTAFGPRNKLMAHRTGINVDLFSATPETWWNQLVCRTGPAELNMKIARQAQDDGWSWNVYGPGFTHVQTLKVVPMNSEDEVFKFVRLPCLMPHLRETLV